MKVEIIKDILAANDAIAEENRRLFKENGALVLNLMSSPGAGKTTLLEKSISVLKGRVNIGVIEGDIQTELDATRISKEGVEVVQINTGSACHLDSNMIHQAIEKLDLSNIDLLFMENVGNLVCPAEFRIGEDMKIMISSITEGDDKPLKYPLMFRESQVLIINKIDLLPYCDCDLKRLKENSLKINSNLNIFEISCKTESGLDSWYNWLVKKVEENKK
ncbi:hydrogenase accessory protein HypB [candidate division Kazan bacterium]|uniref:Hydrogenase accessory protein HypB n=1 Tax=candidate division Kazan bacterium TaxID=2202143 RepID=A0A420ZBQ3_UNCK3|nr:hydrogenase nickel incorporation protein HypB [Deltaproteobacteria bacterium]RLC36570.1 MAG: hydrogenase accessory protein HypB [candidate division Kazan bacterium]